MDKEYIENIKSSAKELTEELCTSAGLESGDIFISSIGMAHVVCARTRPKFIGGQRAVYNDSLM